MSRLSIKAAASQLSRHSYDVSTITSLDFGQLVPTRVVECINSDSYNFNVADGLLRMAPQKFPPYGRCYVKTAAFFVPGHQLIEDYDAFRLNMNTFRGEYITVPKFRAFDVNRLFSLDGTVGSAMQLSTLVHTSSNPNTDDDLPADNEYDFVNVVQGSGTAPSFKYYKLNSKGRYFYKVLKSLGYEFVSFNFRSTYADSIATADYYVNAFTLLAYFKVYIDMFLSGNYFNYATVTALLHAIHDHDDYSIESDALYTASTGVISLYGLSILFTSLYLPHEQNMYTEAWNSPNSPSGVSPNLQMGDLQPSGMVSPFIGMDSGSLQSLNTSNRLDLDGGVSTSQLSADGNFKLGPNAEPNKAWNLKVGGSDTVTGTSPYGIQPVGTSEWDTTGVASSAPLAYRSGLKIVNSGISPSLSSFGLRVFQAFDAFVRRNNLVGSKAAQRVYAMFGIKSDDFRSHYVHKLYEGQERVHFHPVMSNADTSTGQVGDYAGFGVASLNIDFNYKCTDYGYIVVLSWLQVVPMILRGFNPDVLRISAFDFYTPQYDGQTVRAIPMCEISTRKNGVTSLIAGQNDDRSIFGFTNLYDDYRYQRDVIAGDFVNGLAKDFLFCRDYSVLRDSDVPLKPQQDQVMYYDQEDNPDMSDPFTMSKEIGDRFYLQLDWNINAQRPVKSLSDAFELGVGDTVVTKNGIMEN